MSDQKVSSIIKDRVPREKILSRINLLEKLFYRIRDKANIPELKNCKIDKSILLSVVRSYFYDLERLKLFHGIKNANESKIAAYTIKWICKLKPLYVDPNIENTKPTLIVNELFAMQVGFFIMEIPRTLVPDQIFNKLIYNLVYRPFEESSMAIFFDLVSDTYQKYQETICIVEKYKDNFSDS